LSRRFRLIEEIVRLSQAATWEEAKLEWQLADVYQVSEPETCLCGHFPINEVCVLRNIGNGATTEVGNVCVKKFLGLPSEAVFRGLRRIAEDKTKALSAELTKHAHARGWINDWEATFCTDTIRTRKLSTAQRRTRVQINQKVLERSQRRRRGTK
jgi:hypothetical protein